MKTRYLTLDKNNIHLSNETEMFQNKKYVEKNCVYDLLGNVLYELYPNFTILTQNNIIKTEARQFKKLVDHYGSSNIFISVGTPPVKFDNNYLAVAHVKIKYKILKEIILNKNKLFILRF